MPTYPQLKIYNAATSETSSFVLSTVNMNHTDGRNLQAILENIFERLNNLESGITLASAVIDETPVSLPKQLGSVVYNGLVQSPVLDYDSSRIKITNGIEASDAGTYTATASLISGKWEDNSSNTTKTFTWEINKGIIPKPYVNQVLVENKLTQDLSLEGFYPDIMTKGNEISGKDAKSYTATINLNSSNYTFPDHTTITNIPWRIVPNNATVEIQGTDLTSDITSAITTFLENVDDYDQTFLGINEEITKMKRAMITKTLTI